jgi:hypothetical protein
MSTNASDPIIVVSGMPRSGTSLMMSMLEGAGVPLLVDGIRAPDQDNPRGYYELERVKGLPDDAAWLADAPGKAVKVIYRLLYHLPPDRPYRVLFMERDLEETVASQQAMLARQGLAAVLAGSRDRLFASYRRELEGIGAWLAGQPHFQVMRVEHGRLLGDPTAVAAAVCTFLALPDRSAAMAARVDATLYRNRALARSDRAVG